jgi:CRP/FNR family cyclic AMP-dependent transcriptional regulator
MSKTKKIKEGTVLIHENTSSRKMFILKSGKVRVFKSHIGQKVTLATLGPGEVFGELSFFDAEPRSASVEAITDCEAIVIEGDKALEEVGKLPKWVSGVFKSVFGRFREMDAQLLILQSMNEFQKKAMSYNTVTRTIYFELRRYNQLLRVVYEYLRLSGEDQKVRLKQLNQDFDDLTGKKYLGIKPYFESIQEQGVLSTKVEGGEHIVSIDWDNLEQFNHYLKIEVEEERFLLLSFSGISLLRVLVGFLEDKEYQDEDMISLNHDTTKSHKLNYYDKAIRELTKNNIAKEEENKIVLKPASLLKHFRYQNIIKNFDHSAI